LARQIINRKQIQTHKKQIRKLFKSVGVAVLGSLWALEWARKKVFWQSIDIYKTNKNKTKYKMWVVVN